MFSRYLDLSDMCLQVIVQNLDLIICSKTIPQKHIDFLLRLHSEELYKKKKRKISEDDMLWFLNPHVKKVTLPRNLFSERIINQLKVIGSGITSLNLKGSRATADVLRSIISSVPHIKHLDLSYTSCTNETLSFIKKKFPDLISLNITDCNYVTDEGAEFLTGLSLRNLDILGINMEPMSTCIILNGLPSLECFKSDYLSEILEEMSTDYNKSIPHQYNLTEIIFDCPFTLDNPSKFILTLAKMCSKVKKIHFLYPVDGSVLKACTGFQNLEELKIKMSHSHFDVKVNDVLAPILPISSNLKTLILSCLEIPTVTLLEHFINLENLYLKNVTFKQCNRKEIKITETKLDTLVIKDTEMEASTVTYETIAFLISISKNVTKLHLSHNRELPSDMFGIIISSMKNLSLINLSYTFVKLRCLAPFFDIPSMKVIYANHFNDDDIKSTFAKKSSCTFSWHLMSDSDDDDDDFDYQESYCDEYSNEFSDHAISDACHSSDSERDYRHSFFRGYDDYDSYEMYDGYDGYEMDDDYESYEMDDNFYAL